jgi:hypothetical protein
VSEPREAKLYEPPVYCAAKGCKKRLTVAAVNGRSRHCSREHAGFPPVARKGSSLHYDPTDADLEAS